MLGEFVGPDLFIGLGSVLKALISSSQVEACNKEAEKIESLINSDSPTLAAHVPLSALVISQVQVSSSLPSSGGRLRPQCCALLLFLSLGLTLHLLWV